MFRKSNLVGVCHERITRKRHAGEYITAEVLTIFQHIKAQQVQEQEPVYVDPRFVEEPPKD